MNYPNDPPDTIYDFEFLQPGDQVDLSVFHNGTSDFSAEALAFAKKVYAG